MSFYEAFLFCLWDGGRLPTEAEWNAAAAGGGLQRAYPWSDPPSSLTVSPEYARYGQPDNSLPSPVGSHPKGHAVWGTQDLAGNVYEWVRDTAPTDLSLYPSTTSNPIGLDDDGNPNARHVLRGGSFKFQPVTLRTPYRELRWAPTRISDIGFRCVRPAGTK